MWGGDGVWSGRRRPPAHLTYKSHWGIFLLTQGMLIVKPRGRPPPPSYDLTSPFVCVRKVFLPSKNMATGLSALHTITSFRGQSQRRDLARECGYDIMEKGNEGKINKIVPVPRSSNLLRLFNSTINRGRLREAGRKKSTTNATFSISRWCDT
jgi:hypothetical protein